EPKRILPEFSDICNNISWQNKYSEGIALCNAIEFRTEEGRAWLKNWRAHFLIYSDRVADGEHEIREALDEFERISGITEMERKRYRASSKHRLATLFKRIGRGVEAEDAFKEAIALGREVNADPPSHLPPGYTNLELAHCLWWYGNHLDDHDRLKQAEEAFNEAIEEWDRWANQVGDLRSRAERRFRSICQVNLCYVWMRIGRLSEAEAICKSVLEEVQEPHLIGTIHFDLSMICRRMNRPFEALEWSEKAMMASNQMPENIMLLLSVHTTSARILHELGRYSEALLKVEDVLRMARDPFEKAPEVYSMRVLESLGMKAVLLRQTGRISEADKTYREVFRVRSELIDGSPDLMFWLLNDRGVLYFKTDRISKAEKDFSEALELARRVCKTSSEVFQNARNLALLLNNLGNLHLTNGQTRKAREAYEEALAVLDQLSELSIEMVRRGQSTVLNNLGALLVSTGELSKAESKLTESLSKRRELEENGVGYHKVRVSSTLNNLGLLHMRRDDYSEALGLFQEATNMIDSILSQSSLDYMEDLRCTLSNQYIALSKIDPDSKNTENILKRLRELGVKEVEAEEWILDEMESDGPLRY
ncbi:MAG: tetratricopeptide repeat protein, partial [Promethearchaeota archaeon]